MTHHAAPVGGPFLTRTTRWLLGLMALGGVIAAWRFVNGIGSVSALSDGYPWGIWIALDVVIGTAIGCGGYAVAILVYVLNRGKYHPLVRPAVLTSALGYSIAAVAVFVDVGRPWNLLKVPIQFWYWNLDSALLEVALCVMTYVGVLWIELSPAFFEKWKEEPGGFLHGLATTFDPVVRKLMIPLLALGLLLPTMHQSSLGTVMLLAGHKLDPLWRTPLLPLLFLVSVIGMGYAVVVFEGALSGTILTRRRETPLLADLSFAMIPVGAIFLVLRYGDLAFRGLLADAFRPSWLVALFHLENLLVLAAMILLFSPERRRNVTTLVRAALLFLLAGGLYRVDTYLVAFDPGSNWHYFPAVPELFITIGLVAAEVLAYLWIVKRFPVLAGRAGAAGN